MIIVVNIKESKEELKINKVTVIVQVKSFQQLPSIIMYLVRIFTCKIHLLTGMLYLSRLIVNEKQQDITLDCGGVVLFNKQDVKTAFCPGSNAMFPYFSQ